MSLIKQLWLGIVVILVLALGGSFFISSYSAKQYLQQQLQLKNIDNATSLALSMSQMEKNPVSVELLIAAQFDSGHYSRIQFLDPEGNAMVDLGYEDGEEITKAPQWFIDWVDIQVQPGMAQVQEGWQQYGSLIVESHSRYAIESLWTSTLRLLQWFVIAGVLGGVVGTFVLKYISRPLDMVVSQAEAIGERRFVESPEPRTTEFQRLVRAMNTLSAGVKTMLEKETEQLERLKRQSQLDEETGISNRTHFMNLLDNAMSSDEYHASGAITMVRLMDLIKLNTDLGRQKVDAILQAIANTLSATVAENEGAFCGRLNGGDFALWMPGDRIDADKLAQISGQALELIGQHTDQEVGMPAACCAYSEEVSRGLLLSSVDSSLSEAEQKGNHAAVFAWVGKQTAPVVSLDEWREKITTATEAEVGFGEFMVRSDSAQVLHLELPVRLMIDGKLQPAGYFLAKAARLNMIPQIDLAIVETVVARIDSFEEEVAVNVSAQTLVDAESREKMLLILQTCGKPLANLWLEFPEVCAVRHMAELKSFAAELKGFGCKVGLEHVGMEFTHIKELQDAGLHYLKVDGTLIRDLDSNSGNQQLLRSLCAIARSLGMLIIAEGVKTDAESAAAIELGMDGVTGPGVS